MKIVPSRIVNTAITMLTVYTLANSSTITNGRFILPRFFDKGTQATSYSSASNSMAMRNSNIYSIQESHVLPAEKEAAELFGNISAMTESELMYERETLLKISKPTGVNFFDYVG